MFPSFKCSCSLLPKSGRQQRLVQLDHFRLRRRQLPESRLLPLLPQIHPAHLNEVRVTVRIAVADVIFVAHDGE